MSLNATTPVHTVRLLTTLGALALAAVIAAACAGDGEADPFDPMPWTTSVDSTGDTVVVRITGEVPETHVRSLVTDLKVGAEDGSEEETFGSLNTVLGMPGGGLLVHDYQAEAIRLFDAQGAYVRTIGGRGAGPGEYQQVNGITFLSDGRIAVWDATGGRLNVYTPTGDFIYTNRMPIQGWFSQNILHVDTAGALYVRAILERDPSDFTKSKTGFIRMSDSAVVRDSIPLVRFGEETPPLTARSTDGRSMTATSVPFQPSTYVRMRPDGGQASGAGDPYRFYLVGGSLAKPIRVDREHPPVPVSELEASQRREQIERNMKRLNPSWTWTGPGIPSTKPAYRNLEVGNDGRIWVLLSMPAEPIPEAELPPVRAPSGGGPPPVRITTREPNVYDVFSPSGMLLGRVGLPPRTRLYAMSGDTVWGVQRDSLDVEYAVRMRIQPGLPAPR